jgi:peptidoglycan/LPS O-acetylase OafA/YrhL
MIRYRKDIDGLRAYAVIAVILFHLGYLPNGYLGVDIFFVISGFLITSIIYKEIQTGSFSIWKFYERRVRRILPLLFFITSISLIIGFLLMLPYDLEDLAESVFATNISANNVQMLISSSDYWAVDNAYKPLMHTWSLGVEEQFYLIYPFLLLLVLKLNKSYLIHFLIFISLVSISLFLFYGNPAGRFYLLHFRLFELSIGGLFGVLFFKANYIKSGFKVLFFLSIIGLMLCLISTALTNQFLVIATTLFTTTLIITGGAFYKENRISKIFFQNKFIVYVGKISFSLYMWHHLVFAFTRYAFMETINYKAAILLVILTFLLSVLTYHFIENPFRDKKTFSTKKVIIILSVVFVMSTSSALYFCYIGGIYKDFPMIGLEKDIQRDFSLNYFFKSDQRHFQYNEAIRGLDKPFEDSNKPKLLIIGDSFGRDVANIFLENTISKKVDLKYFDIERIIKDNSIIKRWKDADAVVFGANGYIDKEWILELAAYYKFDVNLDKVHVFGTKNFGYSNGIYYHDINSTTDFSNYHVNIRDHVMTVENMLKEEWKEKYVSLIKPVLNQDQKVKVFNDEGKFLSHDTYHLTQAGTNYYSNILSKKLMEIIPVN